MKLSIQRETLLRPLQVVSSVVERRQSSPILANTLLSLTGQNMTLTGTDLEVEMVAHAAVEADGDGVVPAGHAGVAAARRPEIVEKILQHRVTVGRRAVQPHLVDRADT